MSELNREQIIKALECCSDDNSCYTAGCPYKSDELTACTTKMSRDALALIKELTEENERLRAENESLAIVGFKDCEISQTRIYRLRDKHPAVMAIRADTVRKMQKKLTRGAFCSACGVDYSHHIIQIAKEMLEGEQK